MYYFDGALCIKNIILACQQFIGTIFPVQKNCSGEGLNMMKLLSFLIFTVTIFGFAGEDQEHRASRFIHVNADTKELRSELANLGLSIEWVRSDSVWGFADEITLKEIQKSGFIINGNYDIAMARGGHQSLGESINDFPEKDSRFHNHNESVAALKFLQSTNADVSKTHVLGKTIEGREITGIHINSNAEDLLAGQSNKPGLFIVGMHHAREHLSSEVPLLFAQYLLNNRNETDVKRLIDSRDIWIFPMLNADGLEHDITKSSYNMWRKNRKNNGDGSFGVDLNRNYGYKWGTGGSSKNTRSDTYMGTEAFSEPETSAIKTFIESHTNISVLLTVHTFSELILYPWGHTYDDITNADDFNTFKTMAETMAKWNNYTPQASSDLYITSGDTTDWAYGEHGIFAFTFELSPKSQWDGGFYLGAKALDKVFKDNLKPMLYMLDVADNPRKVIEKNPTGWLEHYVQPQMPIELFYGADPLQFIGKKI